MPLSALEALQQLQRRPPPFDEVIMLRDKARRARAEAERLRGENASLCGLIVAMRNHFSSMKTDVGGVKTDVVASHIRMSSKFFLFRL